MKILGAIITFNPDYDVMNFNLEKLSNQVDEILLVNNGDLLANENIRIDKVTIIENKENTGIAKALNIALNYAHDYQYDYLLSMDQDSFLTNDYVTTLLSIFNQFDHVGIVGPNIIEKELGEKKASNVTGTKEVGHVITSGSLNLVEALIQAGGFEDKLFIDMVDLDICFKVSDEGYKIIQTDQLELEHRIGEPKTKKVLLKTHFIRNHAPFRKYFFVRNRLYIAFKYRKKGLKFIFGHLIGIIYYTYIVLFYEKQKILKLKMILLGVFDFIRGNYNNKIMK